MSVLWIFIGIALAVFILWFTVMNVSVFAQLTGSSFFDLSILTLVAGVFLSIAIKLIQIVMYL